MRNGCGREARLAACTRVSTLVGHVGDALDELIGVHHDRLPTVVLCELVAAVRHVARAAALAEASEERGALEEDER